MPLHKENKPGLSFLSLGEPVSQQADQEGEGRFQLQTLKAALGSWRETCGGWSQDWKAPSGFLPFPQPASLLQEPQPALLFMS